MSDYVIYMFEYKNSDNASSNKYHLLQHLIHQFIVLLELFTVCHILWFLHSGYNVHLYKDINPFLYIFLVQTHEKNPYFIWSIIPIFIFFLYLNYFTWFSFYNISQIAFEDSYYGSFYREMTWKQIVKYDAELLSHRSSPYLTPEISEKIFFIMIFLNYFTEIINRISRKHNFYILIHHLKLTFFSFLYTCYSAVDRFVFRI